MHIHLHIHAEYILTQWVKTSEDFFKKYTSHFIWKVCVWEGVGDRTELQYIDPQSYGHQRCIFLVLQGCSTGSPGAHSAGWWLHLPHLVSNSSDLQLTDFLSLPSYIIVHSPTQSLEWHVWSSSSGNDCHAVHRSLSSGASVYECTMGFYLVPYRQPSPPKRFLLITAIGICHFLPVHPFGMACIAGLKVNIEQMSSIYIKWLIFSDDLLLLILIFLFLCCFFTTASPDNTLLESEWEKVSIDWYSSLSQ